jgi:hypothetical protein
MSPGSDVLTTSAGKHMRKFFGSAGSVSRVTVEREALKSNMLGDPSVRVVDVSVPAGHDGEGLLLLVDLVGFTGSGLSRTHHIRDAGIKAAPEVPYWPRQCP